MCPICKVKLLPIVYGKLNPELVDKEKSGQIILGSGKYKQGKPLSFCISCEEFYYLPVLID